MRRSRRFVGSSRSRGARHTRAAAARRARARRTPPRSTWRFAPCTPRATAVTAVLGSSSSCAVRVGASARSASRRGCGRFRWSADVRVASDARPRATRCTFRRRMSSTAASHGPRRTKPGSATSRTCGRHEAGATSRSSSTSAPAASSAGRLAIAATPSSRFALSTPPSRAIGLRPASYTTPIAARRTRPAPTATASTRSA